MNKINDLYDLWELNKSPEDLDRLLSEVRARIVKRFGKDDGREATEDIAQIALLRIWTALPGTGGSVQEFDKNRGDFAAYCATVAQSVKIDYYKFDRLVFVEDDTLQYMVDGKYFKED